MDIGQEIQEAKSELPIAPLADELVGPLATRVMGSAQELGYDWQKLPKLVYQDKCRPDCDKCAFGCPYGAKWTARMYLEEARKNGAILPIMIKAKDSLGGRLTDGGGVRKRLDETDREKLMRGYARAKRILENERHSVSSVPLG